MPVVIQESVSLKPHNTMGFDVSARYLIHAHNEQDVLDARAFALDKSLPLLVLGGGSNVVFTQDFDGVVLLNNLLGKSIKPIDKTQLEIQCKAGELWHEMVLWSIEQGAQGLENLSLIPGTVGAAPIQNIGAYGTDLNDWFVSLKAIDMHTGEACVFDKTECEFAYRDSVFKSKFPQRYVITDLTLRLNSAEYSKVNVNYGGLADALSHEYPSTTEYTAKMVSDIVCMVRSAKLPDPVELGNAGSFFKNPVVSSEQAQKLCDQYDGIVAYPKNDGQVKLAAGWLIEKAGFKGQRFNGVGVHDKQALVLVNYGEGTGQQLIELAQHIQIKILELFGVELEIEPRVF